MENKFFISSLAYRGKTAKQISKIALENSLNIEFSSNIPFDESNIEAFNNHNGLKLIHNYFPTPKESFVINLASSNKIILEKSIKHCFENIKRTSKLNLPFYSVHSGFCLDPSISSLGGKIESKEAIRRSDHTDIFIETAYKLSNIAKKYGVQLLIENNVLSEKNFLINQFQNIFLCVDSSEIIEIMESVNMENFGLLLDTGHLKVSANTLKLDVDLEVKKLKKYVEAVHHSDNNGKQDSNDCLDQDYWFLKYIKYYSEKFHVLEVKDADYQSIEYQINLLSNAISDSNI